MCLNLLFVNSLLLSWWNFHYVTLVWSDSDRLEMQSSCNGLDQKSRNKLSKLFHFVTELCLKSLTKQARFLISLNRPIRSNNLPSLALIKAGRYRLMDQFSLRPRVRIPSKLYCIYSQHCIFLWKGRKGAWFYPHLLILPFVWNCIAFINFLMTIFCKNKSWQINSYPEGFATLVIWVWIITQWFLAWFQKVHHQIK